VRLNPISYFRNRFNVRSLPMNECEPSHEEVASNDSEENAAFNGAELSESVFGRDWNSPQEDAAWSNL